MMGISIYILADTFFIANGIGADGLAALNLAIPIYSFIHGCALMLGTGGATKYIIAKCQGEQSRAHHIFSNSFFFGLILSAAFAACGLFLSSAITHLLNADAALFDMTNTYLKIILLFSPFFITNELLLAYVRSDENPTLAMVAMITGSIANIILDYIFIYPMGMGILGAVLATGIAPIVSMLIMSHHFFGRNCGFRLVKCAVHFKTIFDISILGFPALVTEFSAGIVMIVFNLLLMKLGGNTAVAAYGIIANIALVATAIYSGIAQGTQPLVSEAYSTHKEEDLRVYIKYSVYTAVLSAAVIYAIMFICTSPITSLFNNSADPILQGISENGMRLYFTSLPLTAINIILCGLFTAAERPLPAHFISLLRGLVIVLPMSFVLSELFALNGIWLTVTTTELITVCIAAYLWKKFPLIKTPALQ